MSFGFGVGDCLAVLKLAKELRERFDDAPEQFKAISRELTGLSDVLREIESSLVARYETLTEWQKKSLASILEGCHEVLVSLGNVVDDNYLLGPTKASGLRDKSRKVLNRLRWEPEKIEELRSRVTLNVSYLNAFNESLISKTTLVTQNEVERLHDRQDRRENDEEAQAILDWLTPVDYRLQQNDFIRRRQARTGQWLLESSEFKSWLDTKQQTLFCPGMPGAGKTMLTSIVIEELNARFEGADIIGIAYIYCNYKRKHEQDLDALLSNILKQLVQRQISPSDSLKTFYHQHKAKGARPPTEEILKELRSTISSFARVFIVVDALDECQVDDRCRTRFVGDILSLQADSGANIFATSRFDPETRDTFKDAMMLEIRATEEDVQRYVDGHIADLSKCVLKSLGLQQEIKAAIVHSFDGMFLLAQLYLNSLKTKTTPRLIRRGLEELPKGKDALDLAYEDSMKRIQDQEADFVVLAVRALSWITCAKRPLTTRELEHALSVEPGDKELGVDNFPDVGEVVSMCAGLITIDEESKIIRLAHYTTEEYFQRTQQKWLPEAETEITTTCLTYLQFESFDTGYCDDQYEERLREYALYEYAAGNWGYHAPLAWTSDARETMMAFLDCGGPKLSASTQVRNPLGRYYSIKGMSGIHVAAYFGFQKAILALLESGHDIESMDDLRQTPLLQASLQGHEAAVKLLLEKGAKINTPNGYKRTPLFCAASRGHEAIVTLLLENKAQVDLADEYHTTPLLQAAEEGHIRIVQLLIEAGADPKTTDDEGRTPLHYASPQKEGKGIIRLLLDAGASVEAEDDNGQTPLHCAAVGGNKAVILLLVDAGANLEAKDKNGRTPLYLAAHELLGEWDKQYEDDVIPPLLSVGASLEAKDNENRTLLHLAAHRGETWLVRLLLEAGVDREGKDEEGHTALSLAQEMGKEFDEFSEYRGSKEDYEAIIQMLQS